MKVRKLPKHAVIPLACLILALSLVVFPGSGALSFPFPAPDSAIGSHQPRCSPGAILFRTLWSTVPSRSLTVGRFTVVWENPVLCGPRLKITPVHDRSKVIWESLRGQAFVSAAVGSMKVFDSRGSYRIHDRILRRFYHQTVDGIWQEGESVVFQGRFIDAEPPLRYRFTLMAAGDSGVDFAFKLIDNPTGQTPANRTFLACGTSPDERFFGFGAQYSFLDMKGKRVPILVQEQGIGRGLEPLTFLMNIFAGSGGDAFSTYAAVPYYITNHSRSLFLKNPQYADFDLTNPYLVEIKLASRAMRGRFLYGGSPAELIEKYTRYSGRMKPLPDWVDNGAIVCVQGGSARVREQLEKLRAYGVPVAAIWIHDWSGRRRTIAGSQLWWNWEPDSSSYPDFAELVSELNSQGVKVMAYINPFLVDVCDKPGHTRNLFREAESKGFLVKNRHGEVYLIPNTDFSAGMVDLTNPEARSWLKEIIKTEFIDSGVSGWMADYGEALPFDCVLSSGANPLSFHNRYPVEWARLNAEAVREGGAEGRTVFFTRSGFSKSPGESALFWLGDQLVSWDGFDGIKTALKGLLSSGISGFSLNHSDIGGYTTVGVSWLPGFGYFRTKELLMRWMEMNAFTAVFRTHEGNIPELNCQWDRDEETCSHFSRFARVYRALKSYRRRLQEEARMKGYPLARPVFFNFPDDPNCYGLDNQFMLGSDFLVAPVFDPGVAEWSVYLPRGRWVHLWSGTVLGDLHEGIRVTVRAALGEPPVFYPEGSRAGEELVKILEEEGVL